MKQKTASVPKENGQQKYQQIEAIEKPRITAGLLNTSFSINYILEFVLPPFHNYIPAQTDNE